MKVRKAGDNILSHTHDASFRNASLGWQLPGSLMWSGEMATHCVKSQKLEEIWKKKNLWNVLHNLPYSRFDSGVFLILRGNLRLWCLTLLHCGPGSNLGQSFGFSQRMVIKSDPFWRRDAWSGRTLLEQVTRIYSKTSCILNPVWFSTWTTSPVLHPILCVSPLFWLARHPTGRQSGSELHCSQSHCL